MKLLGIFQGVYKRTQQSFSLERISKNRQSIVIFSFIKVKMVYSCFIKFISMIVYPLPIHVVFKDFSVGGGNGGCALFSPFGFRGISYFPAKKSDGGSNHKCD